ncbi:MAG: hypothetical protein RLZZ292_2007 [Bacteroidota bacterium]
MKSGNFFDFKLVALNEWATLPIEGLGNKSILVVFLKEHTTVDLVENTTENEEKEGKNQANRAFLTRILKAVQVELATDTFHVECNEDGLNALSLIEAKQTAKVLIFGIKPNFLGLNFHLPMYKNTDYKGVRYLYSERLSLVENEAAHKRALWDALKAW